MIQRTLRISGIVAINCIIIIALLEGLLRWAVPVLPPSLQISANWVLTGQPYSDTWTPAWQQNRDHYYALRPGITDELQYGSPRVRFALTTIDLWDGGGIGFRTDPVDFEVDAVVVGDSFGFCFVERADCWVDQFAQQSGLGTVNLSQPVTGSTSHYRILRDFGAPLQPPLVIWQFFGNDFNEDYGLAVFREEIAPIAEDTADDAPTTAGWHQWLRRHSVAYAVAQTALTGEFEGFAESEADFHKPYRVTYGADDEHLLIFGSRYEQVALDMTRRDNQIGYQQSRTAFQQAQTLIADWDGRMVVVLIPTREEVYAHLTRPDLGPATLDDLRSARMAMHGLCAELDLTCYDPIDIFTARAQAGEALYHVDDMHLNAHGNAVLATALQAWLQADDVIDTGD